MTRVNRMRSSQDIAKTTDLRLYFHFHCLRCTSFRFKKRMEVDRISQRDHQVFIPPSFRLAVVFIMGNTSDYTSNLAKKFCVDFHFNVSVSSKIDFYTIPFINLSISYPVKYHRLSMLLATTLGCTFVMPNLVPQLNRTWLK